MSSIANQIDPYALLSEHNNETYRNALIAQVSAAVASTAAFFMFNDGGRLHGTRLGAKIIERERKDVESYINKMDNKSFRRRYRMGKEAFWSLLDIIEDNLESTGEKRKRGATPNGNITKASRLSMAIRYFSGGDPLDIADVHGVSDNEVGNSVWNVVDAIHKSTELDIQFPDCHHAQTKIMLGFRSKSKIGIDCCVGAIDGILIWMSKPNARDQKVLKFGPTKFFCGRKMKYGLNMMAVCDSERRFTHVEIRFPGAASDFYAFDQSHLKDKLEKQGFLRPGFCLFGDNAYINSPYMCTPWRNVTSGVKDAMNYFHSQLRINIECAFGVLVHRWGCLRKSLPMNLSVKK